MDPLVKPQLPADVAEKFDMKTVQPGTYAIQGYGIVNFAKLTVATAQKLVDRGFPYLVAKAVPDAPITVPKVKTAPPAPPVEAGSDNNA
jgi:hypothetical protein